MFYDWRRHQDGRIGPYSAYVEGMLVQQPGLYFPFVHIRDDNWLKVAALYWPSVRRLVPDGYSKSDSLTSQVFTDAEILLDETPRDYLIDGSWELLDALRRNVDRLKRKFSLKRAYDEWDGTHWSRGSAPAWEVPALGWIHATKFPHRVVEQLSRAGLAQIGRDVGEDRYRHGRPDHWIGLHPALAGAYMTALACRVSRMGSFQPLTDQADLRVATPSSDVQAALSLLLGKSDRAKEVDEASAIETYVMLALQHVIPADLDSVRPELVIQCREALAGELAAFRTYVEALRSELVELAQVPLKRRRLETFAEHVESTIERPLLDLEKGLMLHKLSPVRSLLLAGSVTPPVVAGLTLDAVGASAPLVVGTGAVVAVGSAWWQVDNVRSAAKAESPVGYLLDVRDRLTPKTLTTRVRKVLRGTYGRSRSTETRSPSQ